MRLSIQQQIFSQDVAKLILYANSLGVNLTFGEAYRTSSQQLLYYHGMTIKEQSNKLIFVKDDIKTKTKNSDHLRRLAIDLNFFIKGKLIYRHQLIEMIGVYWLNLNSLNRWGGNFTGLFDPNHFERHI